MFGSMPLASLSISTFSFSFRGKAIFGSGINNWIVYIDGGAGFVEVA